MANLTLKVGLVLALVGFLGIGQLGAETMPGSDLLVPTQRLEHEVSPVALEASPIPALIKARVVLANGQTIRLELLEGRPALLQVDGSSFEVLGEVTSEDTVNFVVSQVHSSPTKAGESVLWTPNPSSPQLAIHFDGFGTDHRASLITLQPMCCKTCGGTTACNECVSLPCGCCGCGGDDGCGGGPVVQ